MGKKTKAKICPVCGFAVSMKKFLNQTYYVRDDSSLIKPIGKDKGRVEGCVYCLQLIEAEHADIIEKVDFDNRSIYTFKPGILDNLITRITDFFKPKTKVRKT